MVGNMTGVRGGRDRRKRGKGMRCTRVEGGGGARFAAVS